MRRAAFTGYCTIFLAAKGGINAITQSLAEMEYASANIRVVATAPGGTEAPPRRVPRSADGDTTEEAGWMNEVVKQVKESALLGGTARSTSKSLRSCSWRPMKQAMSLAVSCRSPVVTSDSSRDFAHAQGHG